MPPMDSSVSKADVNRRGFLRTAAASALMTAAVAACAREYVTFHYKLRIVVEIDGRQYEGVSVVETEIVDRRGFSWLPEAPEIVSNSWGDAVVINLVQHGLLFGLLLPDDGVSGFNGLQPQRALSRCL